MLTVTEAACAHLAKMLAAADAPDKVAVRFVVEGTGLALTLDKAGPNDATFGHEGRTVLLLDEDVSQLLVDNTLDIEQTDAGPKLELRETEAA